MSLLMSTTRRQGAALAPSFTTSPVISGTYSIGSVLTCAPGTWTGTAPVTPTYQWRRDGVAIGGEKASTYTVVSADYVDGTSIACLVTLTNSAGSDTDTSNALTCPTNPASILGAALLVWHPNGMWTVSGGLASQWDDLSAASRHVTAAGALRPTETAAVFGALPALTFAPGQALTEAGAMLSGDADFSIFVYAKWISVSTGFVSVGSTAGTRAASTVGVWSGSRWYGGNDNISAVVAGADTAARLYSKTYSASVYEPRRSGVSEGSLGSGGALALGPGHTIGALRVDAGVPAIAGNAHVGEVVIMSGVATGPQIAALEAYFTAKFGSI